MHLLLHILGWTLLVVFIAFVGFQIGSIVERRRKYNFADEELDILHNIEAKAAAEEKAVLAKIKQLLKIF